MWTPLITPNKPFVPVQIRLFGGRFTPWLTDELLSLFRNSFTSEVTTDIVQATKKFFLFLNGWRLLLWTSRSRFWKFGSTFGTAVNKLNNFGNHHWVFHIGTIIIAFLTWSSLTFSRTLVIKLKGGKRYGLKFDQDILNASAAIALGSGNQET